MAATSVFIVIAVVELFSIFEGSSLGVEIAFFAVPAAIAFLFYDTVRSRVVAWLLLTAISLATVALVVLAFMFFWPVWSIGISN